MGKGILVTIALLLLLSHIVLAADVINSNFNYPLASQFKNSTSFSIGGLFSITTDGVTPLSKGIQRAEAFKCAVKAINDAGVLLPGISLHYHLEDDLGAPSNGLYKSLALVQSSILAVVGPSPSAVADPVAKMLSSFGTPLISPAASAATLSDRLKYPTFFRTVASDNTQSKAMVAAALKFGWTLIAAAGSDDTYGSSGLSAFISDANAAGIIVVCSSLITDSALASDISKFGDCFRNSGANVIMMFMNEIKSSTIVSTFNSTNILKSDTTFIASDSWASSAVVTYGNAHFASTFSAGLLKGSIGAIQSPGDISWFTSCYGALNPTNNNYSLFKTFWENNFVCKLTGALPVCPNSVSARSTSSPCLCTGSEDLGTSGNDSKVALVYDAVYAIANAYSKIVFDCSSLKTRDFCTSTNVTNTDIKDAIAELNFTGKSGFISFNGTDRGAATFNFLQFNGTTWKTIGSFDSSSDTVTLSSDALVWKTEASTPPFSQVIPEKSTYTDPVVIIVAIICSALILISFLTMIYFWKHSDKPVIKRSSPIFCSFILVGLILVWISLFLWAGEQNDATCNAKIWLGMIGFGLIQGNLLAKNYRIWRIFDNQKLRARVITNVDLFIFSFIIVGIEIILVGVLMSKPLEFVAVRSKSSALYQYYACKSADSDFQNVMTWVIFGYNGLLIFAGSVLAYLTRKVNSSFNESKFIAVSMYNFLICMVVLTPIYFTTGDGSGFVSRLYVIRSLASLFSSMIVLFALFGPKVRQLYRDAYKEDHVTNQTTRGAGETISNGNKLVGTQGKTAANQVRSTVLKTVETEASV